jgi:hypothetical protein
MAAAIARLLFRRSPSSSPEGEVLKLIALFSCAGLLVSLIMMSNGMDLSSDFF